MARLFTSSVLAAATGISIFSTVSLASGLQVFRRQTTTATTTNIAPPAVPSPAVNLTILEAPNYLTAINETVVSFRTVLVQDRFDQNVIEPLVYAVNSRGLVVSNGDVVWGTEGQLRRQTVTGTTANKLRKTKAKRGYSRKTFPWPHATVIYRYDSCETKSQLGEIVEAGMADWKLAVPYLNFVELSPLDKVTEGVLLITKSDSKIPWCWSNAGFEGGSLSLHLNMQLFTLADANGVVRKTCGFDHATIVHELGHQLGLNHEQNRPDAGAFVNFNCQNYNDPECPNQACCKDASGNFPFKDGSTTERCCGGTIWFEPWKTHVDDLLSKPYDIDSIVHYPFWASAKALDRPTLTILANGANVPDNLGRISKGDIESMCVLYQEYCDAWKAAKSSRAGCADNKCINSVPKVSAPKQCGTCDPISGKNKCHPSASCTFTGTTHHCMCAAGKRAVSSLSVTDSTQQFRLPFPGFEQIVFVAEGVECTQTCDFPHGISPQLCTEVPLQATCLV